MGFSSLYQAEICYQAELCFTSAGLFHAVFSTQEKTLKALALMLQMQLLPLFCNLMLWKQNISPWVYTSSTCFQSYRSRGLIDACKIIRNTSMPISEVEMLMNTNAAVILALWRVHNNILSGLLHP